MHLQFEEFWNCVSDIYNSICYYGLEVADIYFNNASLFCLVTKDRGSHVSLLLDYELSPCGHFQPIPLCLLIEDITLVRVNGVEFRGFFCYM